MADETNVHRPDPTDILSVKSRVSWGAILAGAMVALSIYFLLTMLGVALGVEAAARQANFDIGTGAAIYSLIVVLVAFFFGGWATSRLAVGESKLESVLYGIILWGLLFLGLIWLVSAGMRAGFGGVVGAASGLYSTESGGVNVDALAADLTEAGVPADQVEKVRGYYNDVTSHPGQTPNVAVTVFERNREEIQSYGRAASWWALLGVVVSMATTIIGSLIGSGELPVPVPILGVQRRTTVVRRVD